MSEERGHTDREDIFSKAVKAGKRTYFFDVKSTKGNDYYLTVTESKKRFGDDGKFTYEKHKIFLYKEDFQKFMEGLNEAVDVVKKNVPEIVERQAYQADNDVNFDDLGK